MARDHRYIHCLENDKYYDSCEEAGKDLGLNYLSIYHRCDTKRHVAGYHFKYERKPKVNKKVDKEK